MNKRNTHFLLLLMASFLILASIQIVTDAVTSTDHWKGFINGLRFSYWLPTVFTWLIFILPLNLLVLGLYHWKKWTKLRTLFVLAPSLMCYTSLILMLIKNPETGPQGFENVMGMPLPSSAQDFRSYSDNIGNGRTREVYYFHCEPAETETLIKFVQQRFPGITDQGNTSPPVAGWPDSASWPGEKAYARSDSNTFRVCTLVTDKNEDQVYVFIVNE